MKKIVAKNLSKKPLATLGTEALDRVRGGLNFTKITYANLSLNYTKITY